MRDTLGGLCKTVMLGWARTASDVETTSRPHDEALVSSHAKIHSRNTVRLKLSRPEYSCFLDEPKHIADAVISHGTLLLTVGNYIQQRGRWAVVPIRRIGYSRLSSLTPFEQRVLC